MAALMLAIVATPAEAFQACLIDRTKASAWHQTGFMPILILGLFVLGPALVIFIRAPFRATTVPLVQQVVVAAAMTIWGTLLWWSIGITSFISVSCGGKVEYTDEYLTHLLLGAAIILIISIAAMRAVLGVPRTNLSRSVGPLGTLILLIYFTGVPSEHSSVMSGGLSSAAASWEAQHEAEIASNPSNFEPARDYVLIRTPMDSILIDNGRPSGPADVRLQLASTSRTRTDVLGYYPSTRLSGRVLKPGVDGQHTGWLRIYDARIRSQGYCSEDGHGTMTCSQATPSLTDEQRVRFAIVNTPNICPAIDQLMSDPRNADQVGGRDHFMALAHCTPGWGYRGSIDHEIPSDPPSGMDEADFVRTMIAAKNRTVGDRDPMQTERSMRCIRDAYSELARQDGHAWTVVHMSGYYVMHYDVGVMSCVALQNSPWRAEAERERVGRTPGIADEVTGVDWTSPQHDVEGAPRRNNPDSASSGLGDPDPLATESSRQASAARQANPRIRDADGR